MPHIPVADYDRREFLSGAVRWGAASALLAAGIAPLAEAKGQTPPGADRADGMRLMALGQALVEHDLREHPYPEYEPLVKLLSQADLCFSNLEVAIRTSEADRPTKTGTYFHAAEPVVLDCLAEISIDMLALSNNHAWDLGASGLVGTMGQVEKRQLTHAGAGRNLDEAAAPAVRQTSRGAVALVAMASKVAGDSIASTERPGVNHLAVDATGTIDPQDARRNLRAIERAAEQAGIVLVYQHNHYWESDQRRTPRWQQAWAHQCIDAGATLFVSHGVPLLHGLEIYRQRPIFYGLGNFIFHTRTPAGHYPPEVWQSVVADVKFAAGKVESIQLHPVQLSDGEPGKDFLRTRGRPRLAEGAEAAAILGRLQKLSEPFGTKISVDNGCGVVRLLSQDR